MLDRNVVLVLRTRQDRTERRLKHKKEANPPPMEPPPQLLNNNHLYLDLNMNLGRGNGVNQESLKTMKKVSVADCHGVGNGGDTVAGSGSG
ncbi:hypothetical protein KPH14_002542 [Odynerus spinipes]|uniref:Uncharacterized protein n=1 Tax=Odynerus spinipes TaxID=1348599 RepID=A0AAD9RS50_9HYME|nr:hypothetical protein KPH14_002542 [Odynerus spinipes]